MTDKKDWSNNDMASPVLHFDLTMEDLRDMLTKSLEATTELDRLRHLERAFEYVRGLMDGNRFMRQKPELIKRD